MVNTYYTVTVSHWGWSEPRKYFFDDEEKACKMWRLYSYANLTREEVERDSIQDSMYQDLVEETMERLQLEKEKEERWNR